MKLRKIAVYSETLFAEAGQDAPAPVTRVAACGILANPFAGRFEEDLSPLFDMGEALGERLMQAALPHLPGRAVSYGKAAIVGVNGDIEHGHALLHPKLGKVMRAPVGGGKALIPSAAKLAAAGAALDVPLGHKDDAWSFDHFDAMTVSVADSPRPDEIMMVVALADGGRLNARVGKARAAV
ncbi:peptide synthetase [Leisingera sp. ANG-M1]|uniref:amino acid synthesis family protein n=1 Tax=Leisingera sp. ANG-M1 TaxID=1577895 RepID=UPI00057EA3F4|nr:amino acid synthesis family protein [Leisingera sp. ANG-M1]KIC11633.1 peptide synthetase [Leisingera sp. ANG-M1]